MPKASAKDIFVAEDDLVSEGAILSKLDELVLTSDKVIFETSSVFPFDLFPDRISICPNRVTITYRSFWSRDEYPLQLESITGARVFRTFTFASLVIETFGFNHRPEPIKYLRIPDARMARRYILALIECKKMGIDITNFPIKDLKDKLQHLGKVRSGLSDRDLD